MKSCTSCNDGNMVRGRYRTDSHIGRHVVTTQCVEYDKCLKCGYYELDYQSGALIELYSVLTLLSKATALDPLVLKYARKVLGYTREQLAGVLGLTESIISYHESGMSVARYKLDKKRSVIDYPIDIYRMALVGLCSIAEHELLHKEYGSIKETNPIKECNSGKE